MITVIKNNVLCPQKTFNTIKPNHTEHWPFQLCYTVVKIGTLKQDTQEE